MGHIPGPETGARSSMEVLIDFARSGGLFCPPRKAHRSHSEFAPPVRDRGSQEEKDEHSRNTYFTVRSSAGAGFCVRTERTNAAQRSYSGSTPGGDGLRLAHLGATHPRIHRPELSHCSFVVPRWY